MSFSYRHTAESDLAAIVSNYKAKLEPPTIEPGTASTHLKVEPDITPGLPIPSSALPLVPEPPPPLPPIVKPPSREVYTQKTKNSIENLKRRNKDANDKYKLNKAKVIKLQKKVKSLEHQLEQRYQSSSVCDMPITLKLS